MLATFARVARTLRPTQVRRPHAAGLRASQLLPFRDTPLALRATAAALQRAPPSGERRSPPRLLSMLAKLEQTPVADSRHDVPSTRVSVHGRQAKEAFDAAWTRLEHSGLPLVFPREIIWLNGAPGSGKSENSRFMMDMRGYANNPVVISELLATGDPSARECIATGGLVDDRAVLEALLLELLKPAHRAGALVDGFPRTPAQVETLPLLRDKMRALHAACVPEAPPPRFFVCILHVGRQESTRRQQLRGARARQHNRRVREKAHGELVPERDTDFDCELIAKRYAIFDAHRDTLTALRDHFHFTVIDTERPVREVQREIEKQFRYQSARELSASTYSAIHDVPRADSLRFNARDGLVLRLDRYQANQPADFAAAIDFVRARVVPACRMSAFSGVAQLRIEPEDPLYPRFDSGRFAQMVMDVLAERGYAPCMTRVEHFVPVRANTDGSVVVNKRVMHKLNVRFPPAKLTGAVRDGARAD